MSEAILATPWLTVNGWDLTGQAAELTVTMAQENKEIIKALPVGSSGTVPVRSRLAAIEDFSIAYSVVWDDDFVHDALISTRGGTSTILGGNTRSEGDMAWVAECIQAAYVNGGKVGEVGDSGSLAASGSGTFAVGQLQAFRTVSATGSTGFIQLPAVGASQKLVIGMQAVALTGSPSFVVAIKSAATSGGTYGTRHTFAAITSVPHFVAPVVINGPITDTFWKAFYTLTGTGSIVLRVVVAIK